MKTAALRVPLTGKIKPAFFLVAAFWLPLFVAPVGAFPAAVAHFVLGRPVTENEMNGLLKSLDSIIDPIIEGTDAISVSRFNVGDPKVELSVLIVEPRQYGIEIKDTIKTTDKGLSYSVKIDSKRTAGTSTAGQEGGGKAAAAPPSNGEKGPAQTQTVEEGMQVIKELIRANGQVPSTDRPRTLFLLHGYGVSKKAGLPLALLLAKHGIRTVIPDLRGQGESGGEGITWGKNEPDDLVGLLSALQEKKVVEPGNVSVAGISYGAAMASLWAAKDARVEALILVAPYQQADTKIIAAADKFLGNLKLPFTLTKENLAEGLDLAAEKLQVTWEELSPARAIPGLRGPVLFVASSADEIMPPNEVEEMYQKAPVGSKLHLCEKLPHFLLGLNFTELESLIVDWLGESAKEGPEAGRSQAENEGESACTF